jgi:hypothetical protein
VLPLSSCCFTLKEAYSLEKNALSYNIVDAKKSPEKTLERLLETRSKKTKLLF